jgi:dolichol-phosphate mannosyltransferase
MYEISIVIPVFNNELSIKLLGIKLASISENLKKNNKKIEIIFVDDDSSDNSVNEIINLKKNYNNIKIIKLLKNYGSNNAIQVGLKNSSGNYAAVLPADLQDDPDLILQMYNIITNSNENLVICEREDRDDKIITIFFAKIFYKILNLFLLKNYPKNGFDVFMIKRELLNNMNLETLNPSISLMIISMGFRFKKILYKRKKREHGKSQWTFSKKVNFFWDIFIRYSDFPIKIISRFGLIFSLLSIMYGLYVFFAKLIYDINVEGFATLAILISFLSGLIIFILGLIGEYLIRIYKLVEKNEKVIIETYIE